MQRASPKTGERISLRRIGLKLAEGRHVNERGQPFQPNSIKMMLVGGR